MLFYNYLFNSNNESLITLIWFQFLCFFWEKITAKSLSIYINLVTESMYIVDCLFSYFLKFSQLIVGILLYFMIFTCECLWLWHQICIFSCLFVWYYPSLFMILMLLHWIVNFILFLQKMTLPLHWWIYKFLTDWNYLFM